MTDGQRFRITRVYTVPVTVRVAVPGVVVHAPFVSCVKVAAGTVIAPDTVTN